MAVGIANPLKFREFVTSSGTAVFGGKNSGQNDELVGSSKRADVLLHTVRPGSPFVNVGKNPSTDDVKEAAVFCARYSQAWRDSHKDVNVQKFLKADVEKNFKMKEGTWGVRKVLKNIVVKKEDIENFNPHKDVVQEGDRKR
jgi:predicted ribosome quality control (RQC) complex YloA/Tae2 family protein